MTSLTTPRPSAAAGRDDRDTRLAWLWLAAAPVMLVLAVVARTAVLNLVLGAEESGGGAEVPFIPGVLPELVGLFLLVLPAVLATRFGRRARRQGDTRADVPVALAWVFVIGVGVLMLGTIMALTNLSDTL